MKKLIVILLLGVLVIPTWGQEKIKKKYEFWVDGVCGSCKLRIEQTALEYPNVKKAVWSPETSMLKIRLEEGDFDPRSFELTIAMVGHDTENFKTLDAIYNELPDCCRYRDVEEEDAADHYIRGTILEDDGSKNPIPLIGVNVFWEGTTEGVSTDNDGNFEILRSGFSDQLIISYIGYGTDTILVENDKDLEIMLSSGVRLDIVEKTAKKRSMQVSFIDPLKTIKIDEKELTKAACCNLAESFETNPAVDVSFSDAVTGTRKIEMLGLAGPYVQITKEIIPDIRGLSSLHGFSYVPGPWIEGIQLNMGTGSVTSGFEAITGQINVEYKKPNNPKTEDLYLNVYGNQGGRAEFNAFAKTDVTEKLSTALFLHASDRSIEWDRQEDGFIDMPVGSDMIAMNRWKYEGENLRAQVGIKGTFIDRLSGQLGFDRDAKNQGLWGASNQTNRLEGWYKTGYIFKNNTRKSLGFQLSGVMHQQSMFFGQTNYDATEEYVFSNLIYQYLLPDTDHQIRAGVSVALNNFDEEVFGKQYIREEFVIGAYGEYTYNNIDNWTIVGGIRGDLHNSFGFMFTPRLNVRYLITPSSVARIVAGKGYRTANVFTEQIGAFASNRTWIIDSEGDETPYGLDQEEAWNFGVNYSQDILIGESSVLFSVDAFHTRFINQIIADYDISPRELHIYNLEGNSYSNSFQAQVDFTVLNNLDIRTAYRFNDVMVDQKDGMVQKALSSRHRAFLNLEYRLPKDWSLDATLNWQGTKRIPNTSFNSSTNQLEETSPSFFLLNGQVSKSWGKHLEIYLGGENLLNFRQDDPILSSENPFNEEFDASLIWGPVFGRNIYAGVRYKIFR